MKKIKTNIDGLFIIENDFFSDQRGGFMQLWNQEEFKKEKLNINFSQDNISVSKKNVIRGLHFQNTPHGQTKYVNVLNGKVLDVAVDIRKYSKTFGQHFKIELSHKNHYGLSQNALNLAADKSGEIPVDAGQGCQPDGRFEAIVINKY